jgi:hypothetical protein
MGVQTAQNMQALQVANEIRAYRAQLRADLKQLQRDNGAYYCSLVIEDNAPEVRTMEVGKLLDMIRYMTRSKMQVIFNTAQVAPHRRIGALTSRQRTALARALAEYGQ